MYDQPFYCRKFATPYRYIPCCMRSAQPLYETRNNRYTKKGLLNPSTKQETTDTQKRVNKSGAEIIDHTARHFSSPHTRVQLLCSTLYVLIVQSVRHKNMAQQQYRLETIL
jgi:hypothetical protein